MKDCLNRFPGKLHVSRRRIAPLITASSRHVFLEQHGSVVHARAVGSSRSEKKILLPICVDFSRSAMLRQSWAHLLTKKTRLARLGRGFSSRAELEDLPKRTAKTQATAHGRSRSMSLCCVSRSHSSFCSSSRITHPTLSLVALDYSTPPSPYDSREAR